MNKQHILSEIKRTAEENGGVPLGMQKFFRETGIKRHDWLGKFWARWGDALREAGFKPNQMQAAYTDDLLMEKFIGLIREFHRFPVDAEVDIKARSEDGFPVPDTFRRAFGSKQQFIAKLLDYCTARSGYDDVIALCPAIPTAVQVDADNDDIGPEEATGFVYLMKSGRYYKIGRSNAAGRREYELAIQMPEKLTTIHKIRTDNPAGIEDYWHRRFADKRKNGEWFDLAAVDVRAFKRRRFM